MGNLLYRSLDLQNGDIPELSTIWFDIYRGFNEPAEVRGDHLVIPQKPGMTEMVLVPHRLTIELRGFVRGAGSTRVERQGSWREATDALMVTQESYACWIGTAEWTLEVTRSGPGRTLHAPPPRVPICAGT